MTVAAIIYQTTALFFNINNKQVFLEIHGDETKAYCTGESNELKCMEEFKNRLFVMELFLHCADISNPYKSYDICAKWGDLVVEEFCRQGDKEKAEGMTVSPMCDRDAIVLTNMQMGFIEFVVSPLLIRK